MIAPPLAIHSSAIDVISSPPKSLAQEENRIPVCHFVFGPLISFGSEDSRVNMKAQHILVVDDNEAITSLLERVLKTDGHSVAVASDGREALNAVISEHPDLILTDLDMPETNGYEVCRRIKCDPATRLIP